MNEKDLIKFVRERLRIRVQEKYSYCNDHSIHIELLLIHPDRHDVDVEVISSDSFDIEMSKDGS